MAIYIKRDEAEALVRELVLRTGFNITDIVTEALREKLNRTPPKPSPETEKEAQFQSLSNQVRALQALSATHPILDDRDINTIMYDHEGLPH
jgi:hypothetical protein